MYTPFWYNHPNILYDKNYLFEIFPIKEYDLVRKLNAILRFSIYYSIIVYCYRRNTNIFAVPLITALVTYLIWKKNIGIQSDAFDANLRNDVPNLVTLEDHNLGCTLPNKENPFMNPTFNDYKDGNLMKSCNSYDNSVIRSMQEEYLTGGDY